MSTKTRFEKEAKDNSEMAHWTSCYTIQGVIVLVISNRPRASRTADFKITRSISNSNWTEWSTIQGVIINQGCWCPIRFENFDIVMITP